ncbi:MAG: HlyD family efflux transporter periplasmic adaptor subunit [Anaerolineae bacterium]|nr:HlyD family efflux transporter periplasmic adaptor subunit [Anaerolineae bacterium]
MREWIGKLGLVFLAVGVLATGCESVDDTAVRPAPATSIVPVVMQEEQESIFAEAVVEPARSVTLVASVGGAVKEVPMVEGDLVTAGSLLLRLDSDDAEVVVARAEAVLAEVEAQLALARSGTRTEQIAVVEAQLDVADAAVAQSAAQRDVATAGLAEADVLDAQAQLLQARLLHEQADSAHNDTMKCYDVAMPDGSELEICPTLGTIEEMSRSQLEAADAGAAAAQAQLDMVQARVAPKIDAARAGVLTAVANRDAVEAQLDLALAGARSEAISVAEAGVAQATVALAQARELLAQSRIVAPFDATLTDLPVEVGDAPAQGAPVATLATLDRLQLRTTDLTELDAVNVVVGQPVLVTFDAVPGQSLQGIVTQIDPQGRSQFGEVIYDVLIELDVPPEWMRWGMTAQVEIRTRTVDDVTLSAPVAETPAEDGSRPVLVEATVVPQRSTVLQFAASGEISEVLIQVGVSVRAGDLLAVVGSDNQELAVAAAEAALLTAQAELALVHAGPLDADIAAAEANLAAGKAGLWQAVALRDQLSAGVAAAESAGVQAQLDGVSAQRRQLEAALHWAEGDGDDERASDVRDQLRANAATITALQARLAVLPIAAAARLREAGAGVAAAQGQVNAAQAALDLVLAGPTIESVRVAEAVVQQADAGLAAAVVALSRTELRAPAGGTITQVFVDVGDTVSPGRSVLVLADLAHLRIETTDLTELDVVHVYEGQPVRVTIDALPGESRLGHVLRIKPQSQVRGGDVVYPALIELDVSTPGLRWGMSAAVTFLDD